MLLEDRYCDDSGHDVREKGEFIAHRAGRIRTCWIYNRGQYYALLGNLWFLLLLHLLASLGCKMQSASSFLLLHTR